MCGPSPRPEFEVDAGAEDVFVEAHDGARSASTVADGRAGGVRQVDEQIFDLGRPILSKSELEPGTDRPACFDRTVESRWRIKAGLNIAESSAASSIEECLSRHQRFMDDCLQRFEHIMEMCGRIPPDRGLDVGSHP